MSYIDSLLALLFCWAVSLAQPLDDPSKQTELDLGFISITVSAKTSNSSTHWWQNHQPTESFEQTRD